MTAAIPAPAVNATTPLEAFTQALELETEVTKRLNELYTIACDSADHASTKFISDFLVNQANSERELQNIIDRLTLAGKDACALLEIDEELK